MVDHNRSACVKGCRNVEEKIKWVNDYAVLSENAKACVNLLCITLVRIWKVRG